MPDITMCRGSKCRKRNICYRFRAIANEFRQSWFGDVPVKEKCRYFLTIKGHSHLKEIK